MVSVPSVSGKLLWAHALLDNLILYQIQVKFGQT